jgi:hypothetical protein
VTLGVPLEWFRGGFVGALGGGWFVRWIEEAVEISRRARVGALLKYLRIYELESCRVSHT